MSISRTTVLITAGIVAVGVVLGLFLVRGEQPVAPDAQGHGGAEAAPDQAAKGARGTADTAKGPHGGRLLSDGNFAVEVTLFEEGVPPEFRVYAYAGNKPVDPSDVKLQIQLQRLGAQPESIAFRKHGDYLRGDREIVEPHSFAVGVAAERAGKMHRWTYEQIEGRVRMDDASAAAAGIEIKTAGPAAVRSTLELQGEIQFNGDRVAHVVPRLAGVVVKSAKSLGDRVKRGEVLAVIESRDLADLKSEHLAARTRLDLARATFEREKRLWQEQISPERNYLAARQALAEAEIALRGVEQKLLALGLTHAAVMQGGADALTRYEIRSPLDGVVIEKHLALGEAVKDDPTVFVIADLSSVWAEMTIYPKDLAAVKLGQSVTVKASALDARASGTISYVGALVGEQTRSAKARVTLGNPDQSWRPGLFVTVEVVQDESKVPVAVAAEALQTYRDWQVVFLRAGEFFEARPVELGRNDGTRVEVIKGLAAGDRYAATSSFVLKAELGKAGASHDH
jgi:cobalt-zinc-cadmium efflux system membrane fusion protein